MSFSMLNVLPWIEWIAATRLVAISSRTYATSSPFNTATSTSRASTSRTSWSCCWIGSA